MKIIRPENLPLFRGYGYCEWCEIYGPYRQASHAYACGWRDAYRNDSTENLTALCPKCHASHHDGNEPTMAQLVTTNAEREGIPADQLDLWLQLVRNAPPEGPIPPKPWESEDADAGQLHRERGGVHQDRDPERRDREGNEHDIPILQTGRVELGKPSF